MEQKPSVGRVVHYVSYGTPGGEYTKECRAAIITVIKPYDQGEDFESISRVGLCVMNPTGIFFNEYVPFDDSEEPKGGTWHWPERV